VLITEKRKMMNLKKNQWNMIQKNKKKRKKKMRMKKFPLRVKPMMVCLGTQRSQ
jgi:hypothetical protein